MVKNLMCNGECGMEWWTKLNVNKRLILDVFVITGFVALTGNSWHLSMAATVPVLSTLFECILCYCCKDQINNLDSE